MQADSARGVALAALQRWRDSDRLADEILSRELDNSALRGSDRAFVTELFYGVLRNRTLLDFWIGCLREGKIDNLVRDLLRLGLYQLLIARISPHAAVNETVKLASTRHRAIANAILRNAVRNHADLITRAEAQPLCVRMSHPWFLVERWARSFGDKVTENLCAWNNQPPPLYGRVNRLKISVAEFREKFSSARVVTEADNFVMFDAFPAAALAGGECYLQDPSTRLSCHLLMARPNERVLDACSAPGGKTAYLAERMNNEGIIVACDRNAQRLRLVEENMMRLGVSMVRLMRQDWSVGPVATSIAELAPFDSVLIDAPCTNTGVMRRRVDVRWRVRPEQFDTMAAEQVAMVSAALPLLKPGGTLVYSTCSLESEENEDVVRRLTKANSNLHLEESATSLPWRDGFDGAFAARLRKS